MRSLYKIMLGLGFMLTLLFMNTQDAKALVAGDILFTGYNGNPAAGSAPDTFTFVATTTINSGTVIYFTERGFQNPGWQASGSTEGTLTLTTSVTLNPGDQVMIYGLTAKTGATTAGSVSVSGGNATTGLSLSNAGDQVIAFQGGGGDPAGGATFIAGINWALNCGTTTDANWNGSGCTYGAQTSYLPTGLTGGTDAFLAGTAGGSPNNDHARFNAVAAGAPFSSVAALKTAIMTKANWSFGGATGTTVYQLDPGGTPYYSSCTPPAVTGQPSNATICPAANTSFTVTASNATGYQWQVNTGSGFNNITNGGVYSNATTATLNITGATAGMTGYTYQCIVSGACLPNATSNTVTLTITAAPSISVQPSGVSLCEGNTSFSVTASNATGYQWRVNPSSGYVNVTNTGVYTGATTSTLTLTGANGTMNNYNYQVIVSNGCTATTTSSAATLTITPDTWTGTTSSSWNVATNWSCGVVPASTTNVVIPSGVPNDPQVNVTNATCNNITINSGGNLSFVAGSNVLDVKANFTNSGTFNATAGKLKLSGTAAQTVPAATYKDFELAGNGTKTAAGAITITGVLTLTTGFLQLGNFDLTLGNSASIAGANAVLLNTSPTSFIITNVATSASGQLKIQNIGTGGKTGAVLFPIGTSTSSYTPFTIQNAGTADVFGGRVRNNVYKSYNAAGDNSGPQQNTYNVGKTWMISEATAGGSNATVNFAWASNDEQPGFNDGACFASHYENGGWRTVLPAQTANGFDPYSLAMNNITSFSPFAIGSQFSILPLDLLSFTGKKTDKGVALNWVTANEKNVAGFDIERSVTGGDYKRIGNVPARANNSTTETTYNYTDATVNAGTTYYRLKMNDVDGTYTYSNTVVINSTDRNAYSFTVYPNPVDGNDLHIQLSAATPTGVDVKITDMTGRVWYQATAETGKAMIPVNIKSLPAGIYQLHLSGDAINGTTRFTKL